MGHSNNALTFVRHNIMKSGTGRYVVKKSTRVPTLKLNKSTLRWNGPFILFVCVCAKFYLSHEG